ncbi:3-oxoadipate enol-lactonase [Diaphorobacter aerolatus]|uniref:3-oxoadipate enol-lactonase n=1 Tax=Diaphorobacter aerolatus TaxID=1288495 RepID=UPI001D028743|nr:3-oxoadipate enol-lactonase [Diaphorobacter aerolatus]
MNQTDQFIPVRDGKLRVRVEGPQQAPALVFSNSLGTTLEMWDEQAARFAKDFRVVRYDTRGHGGSTVSPGPYSFDLLGADVVAVLDALKIERAHFCGISMGGFTGLWLAINAASRMNSMAVCNSAAKIGTPEAWNTRAAMVRANGVAAMQELADSSPERWFTKPFTQSDPQVVARAQAWIAAVNPQGYASCCDALAGADVRDQLARIAVRTLVIAGSADPVTTVADGRYLQQHIAGATFVELPASHLSNLEAPEAFDEALAQFLRASEKQ